MSRRAFAGALFVAGLASTGGCGVFTDAATRLAFDIEAQVARLGRSDGAKHTLYHRSPSKRGECVGPYRVQLDKVGLIVVWCKDAADRTVSSHSTSYHARFVETPQTYIVDKHAGATLTIDLERRNGRAVIADVR
jgi:hypothetical protein